MNTIKIYLAESGGIANLVKDFSIYQHSYQNKLLNIFVPTSILAPDFTSQLNGVTTGEYVAGTAVKIGISYTARNGSIKTSESRYLNYIKVLKYQNVEYALFERMLPKEFTLYAGQGANAPILTTNVVNVQTDVEEGETPIVLSIITSQTCNLDVMASTILDNEEVVEASELETINARLNSIDETLAEKQDITDEALDTTSKTIVGGINELKATSDTHTTQIGDNTEDIAENQNDIDYLYSHMAQAEEYIGQMTGSALPSDSALTDFVVANTDPSRQPKNADVIIFILQVLEGTDKNYKYVFSVTSWNGFEIPPVEQASNGTKGILEGTYSVGLTHNTLVNISGGQILNIYVKDTTGTYRDIREYANTLNTTIQSIIAGDTSVGLAVKSLQDGLGNNIVNTYLTQNAGATKQYVRDYSLPREFNDIYFIASTGYQDTIPTTPESGIQFSGTSSAVGDLTLFQIEKVSVADFELSSKNSSQNTIYVSADRNCSVYFRLSTQAKNIGQDWVDLSVELSNQISLTSGEIYKLTFSSAFSSLGTTVMTLTDNDLIRQTFEVVTQESAETTFDVYSNETYTSSYAMNTQSQVQIIAQGDLGEQPVYEITGELVGGVITFELDDPTILNNNVEARFVLNYTTATVPEDSTEIVLVLNEQNIRLVTPYNLDTGNAIVRYLSQVNNQFTGGVQTWAFKGFIQIDGGDNISIIVDEDDISELQNDVSLKVDKTTTGSVRRVYGVNASNSQELTEIENTPTDGSTKLVDSNGIYDALATKANSDASNLTSGNVTSWMTKLRPQIYVPNLTGDNFYYLNSFSTLQGILELQANNPDKCFIDQITASNNLGTLLGAPPWGYGSLSFVLTVRMFRGGELNNPVLELVCTESYGGNNIAHGYIYKIGGSNTYHWSGWDTFKSKVDKTTTGSVRRVYGINVSNEQELTEIKDIAIESSSALITSGGVYTILGDIETLLAEV